MTFRVTFGQKYRTQSHPYYGHPDGWVEVVAENIMVAESKVKQRYGHKYSCIYSPDSDLYPTEEFYPKGLIERII